MWTRLSLVGQIGVVQGLNPGGEKSLPVCVTRNHYSTQPHFNAVVTETLHSSPKQWHQDAESGPLMQPSEKCNITGL